MSGLVFLKDLGLIKRGAKQYTVRMGRYQCPECNDTFDLSMYYVKSLNPSRCRKCGNKKHGMWGTSLFRSYDHMVQRCHNINNDSYHMYGERGIKVCDKWLNDRNSFFKWALNNGWKEGLSIDRIDNDKGYHPKNCRWADATTQVLNRRILSRNTSGYRGVSLIRATNKWKAQICSNYKNKHIGNFETKELAAKAYNDYIDSHNLQHIKNKLK